LTQTLLGVANATFETRAPRSFGGDDWDVLAFLVNSTADEVQLLVGELEAEREELQLAQGRLVQSEKLAALGRLAAGVAHEMNQPLTVIASLTDLVRLDPSKSVGACEEELAMIAEAARQLSRIVDSIRTFGRSGRSRMGSVDPVVAVRGAAQLLATRIQDHQIPFEWSVEEDLPEVVADVDRLRQVFINLIGNAVDATIAAPYRERRIEVAISASETHVVYSISDNGNGVSVENLPRVFEPFFSTKPVGDGTGLGLSVAHGIIIDHGGTLQYEPRSGWGATFSVCLPIHGLRQ